MKIVSNEVVRFTLVSSCITCGARAKCARNNKGMPLFSFFWFINGSKQKPEGESFFIGHARGLGNYRNKYLKICGYPIIICKCIIIPSTIRHIKEICFLIRFIQLMILILKSLL